jgi:GMP reductase
MIIENEVKLDFKDVLFKPMRSTLRSRSEVQLERTFSFKRSSQTWTGVPIMSANMDTVSTFEMAEALMGYKMLAVVHKHYSVKDWKEFISKNDEEMAAEYVVPSIGTSDDDLEKFRKIYELNNFKFLCIDVANGYGEYFPEFIRKVREEFSDVVIIAGNVASGDMTQELILSGADIIKVGLGPGSGCTTRKQTGVGIPQLSAIIDCANVAHGLDGHIIGDGGITMPGDASKAFGGGADFIMIGGLFAGHDENTNNVITEFVKNGYEWVQGSPSPKYKEVQFAEFYGMSSKKANDKYAGGLKKYRSAEGRETRVPYRGSMHDTIQDLLGGISSTMTYIGARRIKDIPKCTTFVRVTQQINNPYDRS